MPATCVVCKEKHLGEKNKHVPMFRFPADKIKREQWLTALGLDESDVKDHTRICSHHFLNGDSSHLPTIGLGKRFYSPIKKEPVKRQKSSQTIHTSAKRRAFSKSKTPSVSPGPSSQPSSRAGSDTPDTDSSLHASIGEQLFSDYSVHELPETSTTVTDSDNVVLNAGLLARVEYLEAEIKKVKDTVVQPSHFRLEHIMHDDTLVRFYTGFPSYEVMLAVFEFLGPAVNKLRYWGTSKHIKSGKKKLDPMNQFFLTLIRLRLNTRVKDLAVRFGLSIGIVSRYVTTWICFLYHDLKEIEWMPSPAQVVANLPHVFKERYPSTFAIIDGSEIFIETPSDLHMQSSTWSDYKHHNTCKFLVACTPNGAVSYISPLYVGSISDVQLTRVSGFIEKLPATNSDHHISIMADRGFTVKDQLDAVGVDLNIPAFLSGRQQLSAEEVQHTRHIASVRIHVERSIGRIKNFSILKSTLPLTMARLANQIVSVCAWLTSFQPSIVPLPHSNDQDSDSDSEVEDYFNNVYDSDYDGDSSEDDF